MSIPGIPVDATNYIRSVTKAGMRSVVQVVTPDVPVYDDVTGFATGTTKAVGYSGPATVHDAQGGSEQEFADGLVEVNTIQIAVPFDATPVPQVEDHLTVTATDDPTLVGETLRIISISNGGVIPVVRTLTCTFVQANPFNPGA